MMTRWKSLCALICFALSILPVMAHAQEPTPTGITNTITGEAYVDETADTDRLSQNLPSGLGTQHLIRNRFSDSAGYTPAGTGKH